MRHALQVLAALLLAVVIAAPAAAAAPGGAVRESVTGTLETAYIELGDGRDHFVYSIRNADGITPVEFERGDPRSITGSRVTVTGTRLGDTLRVRSAEPGPDLVIRRRGASPAAGDALVTGPDSSSRPAVGATVDETVVDKSIAVVMFNFTDLATTPFTESQVRTALLDSSTSTKQFFEEESKGRMTVSGAVFGWYTIAATTAGCSWSSWHTLAWNAANAAGANLSSYTNVMFVFPYTSACPWAGLGYVPGSYTYLNGTLSVQVMAHELGHNFGLAHSNVANCVVDETRVMIAPPSDCVPVTYADPFSIMGSVGLRHDHGSHLGELGWLAPEEKAIAVPGNTYTLRPYFGGAGLKLVRVPRGDGSFFDLDTRMTYGVFDTFTAGSPVTVGATIRIGSGTASPTWAPEATLLLDSIPSTSTLVDAPLAVGQTMTDPVSKLSITTLSADSSGVVVRVRDGYAPSMPGNLAGTVTGGGVEVSWTASTDDTAVTGYQVTRDGSLLTTTGGGATAWIDTGATSGATHTYGVTAVDGSTNASVEATVAIMVTTLPDTTGPSKPANFHKVRRSGAFVKFNWAPSSDDVGVVRYQIYRVGRAKPVAVTTVSQIRIRTVHGARYYVRAVDAAGNVSEKSATVRGRR